MVTLKNRRTTTIFTIPQYPTTATTNIPTTLSIPTPITYELKKNTTNNLSPHIGGGSESCCKGGKCDCCMSDILKFLLSGTDGGGSGICTIVVLAMV